MPETPAGLRPPGWEETAAACPAFRSGDFVCPSFAHDRSGTAENLSVYALRTSNRSAAEACSCPLANRISINTTEASFRGFATRILIKEARNEFPRICNSHIKQRRSERYPSHLQPAYETKATTGTSFRTFATPVPLPLGRRIPPDAAHFRKTDGTTVQGSCNIKLRTFHAERIPLKKEGKPCRRPVFQIKTQRNRR